MHVVRAAENAGVGRQTAETASVQIFQFGEGIGRMAYIAFSDVPDMPL